MTLGVVPGGRYSRWEALSTGGRTDRRGNPYWVCRCDCGTIREVSPHGLLYGTSRSCGCLKREVQKITHTRHGQHGTKAYAAWRAMRDRCENRNNTHYLDYGGRGIGVYPSWKEFSVFLRDMGHPPGKEYSLDRIDNDGNYAPGNCRWATAKTQNRNKRTTLRLVFRGRLLPFAECCDVLGVRYGSALRKLRGAPTRSGDFSGALESIKEDIDRRKRKKILIWGVEHTLSKWCRLFNVTYSSRVARIRKLGWSPVTALMVPCKSDDEGLDI